MAAWAEALGVGRRGVAVPEFGAFGAVDQAQK